MVKDACWTEIIHQSQKFAGVTSRLHSLCCLHLTRKLRGPKGNSVAWSTALQAWGWQFDAQCFLHAKLCCLGFPNARSVLKQCVISSAHSPVLAGTETMMHNPFKPWNWMCWNTVARNVSEHQRLLENTITNIYTSTRTKVQLPAENIRTKCLSTKTKCVDDPMTPQ